MPLMTCRPGAGLWTRDSTHYTDDGSGEVFVADKHYDEALLVGWKSVIIDYDPGNVHEEPDESPQSAAVLDETPESVAAPQSIHTTSELTIEEPTSPRRSARR